MTDRRPRRPAVVLLAGPSGSGKSRLAASLAEGHGWPVVRLDDFYRDEDDPALPRSQALGIVDWDDPRSWNAAAATAALDDLVCTGSTVVPRYDISASRALGETTLTAAADALVVADGIFAAELAQPLRQLGLLRAAYVVHRPRQLTFLLRLLRDLRERRKPPGVLVRRGWALLRAEPDVVAAQVRRGAVPRSPRAIREELGTAGGAVIHSD